MELEHELTQGLRSMNPEIETNKVAGQHASREQPWKSFYNPDSEAKNDKAVIARAPEQKCGENDRPELALYAAENDE